MAFNKDKKKKLAALLAKCRAPAAGVGTSTPTNPPLMPPLPQTHLNQPLLTTG